MSLELRGRGGNINFVSVLFAGMALAGVQV